MERLRLDVSFYQRLKLLSKIPDNDIDIFVVHDKALVWFDLFL